jgi:hypothetical protein
MLFSRNIRCWCPWGEEAQFRPRKDKVLLRVEGLDGNQREYVVLSMKPRFDSSTAQASISHANHHR